MYQKYYDDNVNSKFIKELLRTTYIPTVPIWKPGDIPLKGLTYITNDYIVKCKEDWTIEIDNKKSFSNINISQVPEPESKKDYIGKTFTLKIVYQYKVLGLLPGKKTVYYRFITTNGTVGNSGIIYNKSGNSLRTGIWYDSLLPDNILEQSLYGDLRKLNGWEYIEGTNANYYIEDPRLIPETINSIYDCNQLNKPYFEIIQPYVKGEYYRGITSNYISNSSLYDYKTHYYLGEYLRYIRDLDGINLMPYYNCWDGRYSDRLNITKYAKKLSLLEYEITPVMEKLNENKYNGYKTLIVPIKINTDYTVYINSNIAFELGAIYYDGVNILTSTINGTSYNELFNYKKVQYSSFNQPFIYRVDKTSTQLNASTPTTNYTILQNQLVMLIKISEKNESPILILEGNYIDNKKIITTEDGIRKLSNYNIGSGNYTITQNIIDKYFGSVPKLTKNITTSYAFDNLLIQYLTLNVITKNDEVSDNIKRVQEYITSNKCKSLNGIKYNRNYKPGVWDNNIRNFIYKLVTNTSNTPLTDNINGYIDKDTESIILRGK